MSYISGSGRSVDTGNSYFAELTKESISGNRGAKGKLHRERINKLEVYGGKPLEARIEFARYIVDCPSCNSAEFYFEDSLFFCSLCKNSDIQGKARKVKMPKERPEIEDVLSPRAIKNRHWTAPETVEDLKKENDLHLEVQ